jgi:hypothetical protein
MEPPSTLPFVAPAEAEELPGAVAETPAPAPKKFDMAAMKAMIKAVIHTSFPPFLLSSFPSFPVLYFFGGNSVAEKEIMDKRTKASSKTLAVNQ